mgnify:CR=1 FL=1|jgi:hypothetical protein
MIYNKYKIIYNNSHIGGASVAVEESMQNLSISNTLNTITQPFNIEFIKNKLVQIIPDEYKYFSTNLDEIRSNLQLLTLQFIKSNKDVIIENYQRAFVEILQYFYSNNSYSDHSGVLMDTPISELPNNIISFNLLDIEDFGITMMIVKNMISNDVYQSLNKKVLRELHSTINRALFNAFQELFDFRAEQILEKCMSFRNDHLPILCLQEVGPRMLAFLNSRLTQDYNVYNNTTLDQFNFKGLVQEREQYRSIFIPKNISVRDSGEMELKNKNNPYIIFENYLLTSLHMHYSINLGDESKHAEFNDFISRLIAIAMEKEVNKLILIGDFNNSRELIQNCINTLATSQVSINVIPPINSTFFIELNASDRLDNAIIINLS